MVKSCRGIELHSVEQRLFARLASADLTTDPGEGEWLRNPVSTSRRSGLRFVEKTFLPRGHFQHQKTRVFHGSRGSPGVARSSKYAILPPPLQSSVNIVFEHESPLGSDPSSFSPTTNPGSAEPSKRGNLKVLLRLEDILSLSPFSCAC